jgi:adenylate cyclase
MGGMLCLKAEIDGEEHRFPLVGDEMRLGRGSDNDIVLADFSVSRHHAVLRREADGWMVVDRGSTNGVVVNGALVQGATLHSGDRVTLGVFDLEVEAEHRSQTSVAPMAVERDEEELKNISKASIVRPISEALSYIGLQPQPTSLADTDKRKMLDQAYGNKVFGFLTRLAGMLISADSVDEVLTQVMDIAFEALPVERGFILLVDEEGELSCRLTREKDQVRFTPEEGAPVSQTMFQTVIRERVALLFYDAQSDQRLMGGESVRIHGIRAAMCTPLWSGRQIIGVMQVDSPSHVGTFTEMDLDLLTALANFSAVTVERIRFAHRAERERQARSRLERYHSPAVIEDVMRGAEGEMRVLKQAQVTVLFADLVGFTALAEEGGPEAVAALLEGFFTHAVEAIFAAGGTLDKFIGDCVMAFFGAPMPQEDHARRGVLAAVRLRDALNSWNAQREKEGLAAVAVRMALNSGPVVVGDVGSNRRVDYTVLGDAVNVAARLEQFVSRPGQIVIGPETERLVRGHFTTEAAGEFQLKGLQRKIEAFRVI